MAFSNKNLEGKILSIKNSLRELGQTIDFDGKTEGFSKDCKINNSGWEDQRSPDKGDLRLLLEYEKERNSMLEVRISHKDALLDEVNSLQNELYENIEQLQVKVTGLKKELEECQRRNLDLVEEIERIGKESGRRLMSPKGNKLMDHQKNLDFGYFNALEKRNQELMIELDSLYMNKQSSKINSELVRELRDKLKDSDAMIEKASRDHQTETIALVNKIKKLEDQLLGSVSDNLYQRFIAVQEENNKLLEYQQIFYKICEFFKLETNNTERILEIIQDLYETARSAHKFQGICNELSKELRVSPSEMPVKLKTLIELNKNEHKLYEKLADLLVQFSPKDRFQFLPSPHQVWKWIIRLFEDYMSLRKSL